MVVLAAAFRILPHPPNFSPVTALALFGGAHFADKRAAFLVPLTAMLVSDLVLGFHALIPVIYGCVALFVCLGFRLRQRRPGHVVQMALTASVTFFIVSNLAVWGFTGMYPKTAAGLAACYVAAWPFFQNTLAGDLCFTTLLFGGMALGEWRCSQLRPAAV